MNPKKMSGMMKKLGMSQEPIDAEEVIIKTSNGKIIIKPVDVVKIKMQGQETFQVSGDVHHEEEKEKSLDYQISEDDVKLVIKKTNCTEDQAIDTLIKNEGDIAKTILELKK